MTATPRPQVLAVVLGTATEVGKTWVSAAVLSELIGRGCRVGARKPAQSFDPDDDHPTDADVLAQATREPPETVCPAEYWYPVAMAPPMAARQLGREPASLGALLASASPWADGTEVGLVEAAGGPRSPLAPDGDAVDLVARLEPDLVILVADAGLGTINAVRLSVAAIPVGPPVVVVLNRFDPANELHGLNRDWLLGDGHTIVTDMVNLADLLDPNP